MIPEVKELIDRFDQLDYVVEEELATVLFLMLKLKKPLLLEGPPGVGKTEAANIIAHYQGHELIRLQCYEGLDVSTSVYEWNYQKQLLHIKLSEKEKISAEEQEKFIFSDEFLLKRPLLKAITSDKPAVLLIDEIDRADEEFEAFLLELLSDFQISIPELGTIKAKHKPVVILTSNRTRDLSDALKRRCLYHWVDFPTFAKELGNQPNDTRWRRGRDTPTFGEVRRIPAGPTFAENSWHCRDHRLGTRVDHLKCDYFIPRINRINSWMRIKVPKRYQ